MPTKPIRVHDKLFPTKTAATHAIRAVLYRYPPGQTLNEKDAHFMLGVLALHKEAAQKVGVGVASFSVEVNPHGTRGFWLTRTDGTRTDFSFIACLTPPSHGQEVKHAFREEVRDQIAEFRAAQSAGGLCPVTGDLLTEDAHVDHVMPFIQLTSDFLACYNLEDNDIRVTKTTDGQTRTLFTNRFLANLWKSFHLEHAQLRLVSKRANLSILRRGGRA